MAKRKPCRPKPKEPILTPLGIKCLQQRTPLPVDMDYLYELTLGNPKQAHVLCPVHIK